MDVPIIKCRECSNSLYCYNCDERVHQNYKYEQHNRTTISFRDSLSSIMSSSRLSMPKKDSNSFILKTEGYAGAQEDAEMKEQIERKRKILDDLKTKELGLNRQYQDKVLNAKKKYE